ncbi:Aldo/keto reductase [Polyporus arcularius HHB13444]|uniref:Aldo/keto reductase n=1 Tax=Polyporus arcularius HHB13444 TaxID=1314778 RepID=A0A5C3NPW6_9APHY|nr:Aldo/keto reductase [Polyporus arcularius HHB13444]
MSTVSTRKLGDATVSAIGYGAMGISTAYGTVLPDEERLKILDALYETGCTHWDTANVYGDSEVLLGKWFKKTGKRNDIFLATKFGMCNPALPDGRLVCGDPEYATTSLEKSLDRLGVDKVDLWYLHRADQTVPIEKTVAAMAEQVKAGKVRYLGLSEVSAATLRRAHAVHPITALQVEYSPFSYDIEKPEYDLLRTARELGVKIVAYSPVGRGLLTGRFRSPDDLEENDRRRILPRFSAENFPNVLKIVDGIKAIADKHGATPGQVAIAWVLAQGDDILPIPGSTKIANIKENMDASAIKLAKEEVEQIRKLAVEADKAIGTRYPAPLLALTMADTPPLN